jgi:hypothetical protein
VQPVLSPSKEGAQRSMQTPSPRKRGWAFFNSLLMKKTAAAIKVTAAV